MCLQDLLALYQEVLNVQLLWHKQESTIHLESKWWDINALR